MRDLGDLGLLPEELVGSPRESPQGEVGGRGELGAQTVPGTDMTVRSGLPWFETMIEGSLLGRVRVRRGEEVKEGRKIEWEVVEWVDDGERSPRKRTIDDVEMEGKGKGV